MRSRNLNKAVFVRSTAEEIAELHATAKETNLPMAEIARRCMRIGLAEIRKQGVPGSPVVKKERLRA
jgi:hypothetical protein